MPVTAYLGTVHNEQVHIEDNIALPENSLVFVVVPDLGPVNGAGAVDLRELLPRMPDDYQVSEESFGVPVGKELW